MKRIFIIIATVMFVATGFLSCKKGYTCACSSNTGFYDGFDIKESKKRAKKKCDDYYKSNYESRLPADSTDNMGVVRCELNKGQ